MTARCLVGLLLVAISSSRSMVAAATEAWVTHPLTASVTVLDVDSGATIAQIPVGQAPESLVASGAGDLVYVLNRCGRRPATMGLCEVFGQTGVPGTVSVIDTSTKQVVATIDTVGVANGLVLAPDDARLYVTTPCAPGHSLPCAAGFVSIVDTTTRQEVGTFQLNDYPFGAQITRDGKAFVVPLVQRVVRIVDLTGGNRGGVVPVGAFPVSTATNELRRIVVVNGGDGTASIVDGLARQVLGVVPLGNAAGASAISPDGARVYVVNQCGSGTNTCPSGRGTVSVVDPEAVAAVATVTVGVGPFNLTTDARRVFVVGAQDLSIIDMITNAVTATFPLPSRAGDVAVVETGIGGCGDDASFASVACRVEVLDGLVGARVVDESLRAALTRALARARRTIARATAATEAGAVSTAHVALRHASRAMTSFRHRVRSLSGRRLLSRDTRRDLLDVADPLSEALRRLDETASAATGSDRSRTR